MFSRIRTGKSTQDSWAQLEALKAKLRDCDALLIGAGAGLSTAAGFTYSGEQFDRYFSDFYRKYGIQDMYSGGFYPFDTLEEYWAWWSRHIYYNRYVPAPRPVYRQLRELAAGKDLFVLTTNVDHQFQAAGFDKSRLFYTQGDYGLWQCSKPCHHKTYDNRETVLAMLEQQKDMKIPPELIPRCPVCGAPMTMNLRADNTFVEDAGWHRAAENYQTFLHDHRDSAILFLELGVGGNTPAIIKYPFWRMTAQWPNATYACINLGEAFVPPQIEKKSLCINTDIAQALTILSQK